MQIVHFVSTNSVIASMQDYVSKIGATYLSINVYLKSTRFDDNEITENWYKGLWRIHTLMIELNELHSIHANAFDEWALEELDTLKIIAKRSAVRVWSGVFDHLENLKYFFIESKKLCLPSGLFYKLADILRQLKISGWPSDLNLNEMFDNQMYRTVTTLHIEHVASPQRKFRLLHASNFTAFRRLQYLLFIDCGIEVISDKTFDVVGRTLWIIHLTANWIKAVSFEMFRIFFETKFGAELALYNRFAYACTCETIEFDVLYCPFEMDCYKCWVTGDSMSIACGVHRDVLTSKLCADASAILRIISVRMAHNRDSDVLWIQTNLTSKNRILFVDSYATGSGGCDEKASKSRYTCLNINKTIDKLDLRDIETIRGAEFISITAIPILYNFGAKPMHLMTVRRQISHDFKLVLIAISIGIAMLGVIVGVALAIGCQMIRSRRVKTQSSADTNLSYEHLVPTAMIQHAPDPEPSDYDEIAGDYIEIVDPVYTIVY